ncbi:MAG: hypothetical protein V4585_22560 [Bacteroidota bacterium]
MKIYWKDEVAYDEKHNFLAIIHKMPNNYFCGFLNYRMEDIDYRQLDVKESTLDKAKEKMETIFKEINDISEIVNLLSSPYDNSELPSKFLDFLSEFAIHRP